MKQFLNTAVTVMQGIIILRAVSHASVIHDVTTGNIILLIRDVQTLPLHFIALPPSLTRIVILGDLCYTLPLAPETQLDL